MRIKALGFKGLKMLSMVRALAFGFLAWFLAGCAGVALSSSATGSLQQNVPGPGSALSESTSAIDSTPSNTGSAKGAPVLVRRGALEGKTPRQPLSPIHIELKDRPRDMDPFGGELVKGSLDLKGLSMGELLSQVVSEVLGLDLYIQEGSLDLDAPAGLSFSAAQSSKHRLWELTRDIVEGHGAQATLQDGTVLIIPRDQGVAASLIVGIGRSRSDIPSSTGEVLQIIPVEFSFDAQIDRVLSELSGVRVGRSSQRNAYLVRGTPAAIARAQDLIAALDAPAIRGQRLSYRKMKFLAPSAAIDEVRTLLSSEGVYSDEILRPIGEAQATSPLLFVPLPRDSSVVIFSSSAELISRANYWFDFVDQPGEEGIPQYYLFKPQYARSQDLIETFRVLWVGEDEGKDSSRRAEEREFSTDQAPSARASGDGFTMVLDANTNGVLVRAVPDVYAKMLEVFELLDTSPAQVLMEVTIAEVSLQGEFRMGFEWALSNNGIDYTTLGAFGADSFSGLSVSFQKDKELLGRLLETNSLVRILSSPTLLVREGETATVNIGTKVSVVGQTTFDPLVGGQRQTTAAEYLETGVQVSITPTISGSEIANLEIDQTISNTVPGSSGAAGNPDIFERSLKTSVLSRSGEAILLAGLISENNSESSRGLPILSRIPFLGSLAGSQQRGSNRTELIMIVSPTIFKDTRVWGSTIDQLKKKLGPELRGQIEMEKDSL